jgi:hypothetical protein
VTNFKALSQAIPTHDYQSALQGALSWLGSRYLLAEPLNRRRDAAVPDIFKAERPERSRAAVTVVVTPRGPAA